MSKPIHRRWTPWLLAGFIFAPLQAGPPTLPSADPEANLRLLRELRTSDPEQYDRLRRNFERFRVMPAEQQERLRQLDRQLQEEDAGTQARMLRVMEEYSAWLSRLSETDRQRVLAAPNVEERLKIVRELKMQEYVRRLPTAQLAEWQAASETDKKTLVERWRQEERMRREDWYDARRIEAMGPQRPPFGGGDPYRQELTRFVQNRLIPMLTPEELKRLQPLGEVRRGYFPTKSILELAERHPVLTLGPAGPSKKADLPLEYQKALDNAPSSGPMRKRINELPEGRWPEYAIKVTQLLRELGVAMKTQLGPASAKELSPKVQEFVDANFKSPAQREKLRAAEGKWPEYPLALHELARKENLAIPEMSLPGSAVMWEEVRNRVYFQLPRQWQPRFQKFVMEQIQNQKPDEPPVDNAILLQRFIEQNPELRAELSRQGRSSRGPGR